MASDAHQPLINVSAIRAIARVKKAVSMHFFPLNCEKVTTGKHKAGPWCQRVARPNSLKRKLLPTQPHMRHQEEVLNREFYFVHIRRQIVRTDLARAYGSKQILDRVMYRFQ